MTSRRMCRELERGVELGRARGGGIFGLLSVKVDAACMRYQTQHSGWRRHVEGRPKRAATQLGVEKMSTNAA